MRLQIDQQPPAVQRRIGAVDADEGGEALDIRILQDRLRQRFLPLRHGDERDRLLRLRDTLDEARILDREEAFRDDDIEISGHRQRRDGDDEGERLVIEHDRERAIVAVRQPFEPVPVPALEARLVGRGTATHQPAAHHRHQGERHRRRDQDGHGQGDCKFAEQPPHHVAHEQHRDEHGNERDGQRHDGEADLLRAFERRLERRLAFLDVARDVFDHHDRVVDDEAGGDRERHQRQVVETVAEEIHDAEGADQRQRHRQAGDDGGAQRAEEQEDHRHDQEDGEAQLELDIAHRGADRAGAVGEDGDVDRRRQRALQLRQQRPHRICHGDDIGARLALDVEDHRRLGVHPGGELDVLGALRHLRHIGEMHRRAVLVGDHQVPVIVGALQLVIGVDGVGARRSVEIALGRVDVGVGDGGAEIVDVEAVGGERTRIGLDAHRRPLAAIDADEPDAGQLRDLLRQPRIGEVLDLVEGQRLGRQGERQDRRVGRIDLGIDRRRRQIGRKQIAGRIDRRLHFLLGDIEADRQVELQGDDRRAGGTRRRHLVEARHLPELPFERRRHR